MDLPNFASLEGFESFFQKIFELQENNREHSHTDGKNFCMLWKT